MLLSRAISLNDLNDFNNGKNINCSLIRTHEFKLRKNHQIYYDLCIKGNREYALDTIAGHIAGGRLRVGLSPWISSTKDFNFACSEYAIPQAGAYNEAGIRKPIILIEANEILYKANEIKCLRTNTTKENLIIDVSNNNLNNLYGNAFMSEAFNQNMPGFNLVKYCNHKINPNRYNVKGLNNYAFYSQEVLHFKQIQNKDIKCIIYPMLQDILYGCNIDINKSSNFLIEQIDQINLFLSNVENICHGLDKDFLNFLYPNYTQGNNLTDYLYNNYNNIKGNNIYEKYELLKKRKKEILKKIVAEFNVFFNSNLNLIRIVDDEILVFDFDNPTKISVKQINDLLLVKQSENLYKYNAKDKKYIFEENKIEKTDIKKLIKEKQ